MYRNVSCRLRKLVSSSKLEKEASFENKIKDGLEKKSSEVRKCRSWACSERPPSLSLNSLHLSFSLVHVARVPRVREQRRRGQHRQQRQQHQSVRVKYFLWKRKKNLRLNLKFKKFKKPVLLKCRTFQTSKNFTNRWEASLMEVLRSWQVPGDYRDSKIGHRSSFLESWKRADSSITTGGCSHSFSKAKSW